MCYLCRLSSSTESECRVSINMDNFNLHLCFNINITKSNSLSDLLIKIKKVEIH